MSESTYELVDQGTQWAAMRDGDAVFETWGREYDPHESGGPLAWMTEFVQWRWGRAPEWVPTSTGWRAQ